MIENVVDMVKKIKDEVSDQVSLRRRDIFFSYFIAFELIYNWKFLYTLISGKDPEKVEFIIKNAEKFIEVPGFFKFLYETIGEPSSFVLALWSSILMTVAYPFVSSGIMFVRKCAIYNTNKFLISGYPTSEEYKELLNRNALLMQQLKQNKAERINELGLQSSFLHTKTSDRDLSNSRYIFCMPKENSSFEEDEVYQADSTNSCLIEKLSVTNLQKGRIGIVIAKITDQLYFCAQDISSNAPVSKRMSDSGREFYGVLKNGKPHYFDTVDESSQKGLLFSMPIRYEKVGSSQSLTFY